MQKKPTEEVLLERWRAGSEAAYNILFDRYFNKLLQFTKKKIANHESAEELVMDVMLRLWQNPQRINPELGLSRYLFGAIKNAIIDELRKKALQTISMDTEALLASIGSLDENQHAKDLYHIYIQSLDKLSPQRKLVFELSRNQGKSHKEISTEMNITVSTVKQHINASLQVIRKSIKDHTDITVGIVIIIYILH